MSVWQEILAMCASGDSLQARRRLREELVESLRGYSRSADGARRYVGPLPRAASKFVSSLPRLEQAKARLCEDELVDYILDDVVAAVERSIRLVEICLERPEISIDELVARAPWADGLKRSVEQRRTIIVDMLRSMLAADITLPASIVDTLADAGEPKYEFNEIKFSVSSNRLRQSWKDFSAEQGLMGQFLCIVDSDADSSIAEEGVDYGSVTIARVMLEAVPAESDDLDPVLREIGEALNAELHELLETMHVAKPRNGFRPVAWHSVFWTITDTYASLCLSLDCRDPYHETDGDLAAFIGETYTDVGASSRVTILRRRDALYDACREAILARVRATAGQPA